MKKVSIITVNFNHSHVTEELLASVALTNTYKNIEIIVVDNGSKDDPVPGWRLKYPDVNFIRSEQNLGFAGGNNLGIDKADGAYLFFVNNDTEFTPGLIGQLVSRLEEHPQIGMISPRIRYYDQPDTLQYAGFSDMNYYTARTVCIGQYEKDAGQYVGSSGLTGFVHGAAMMVRRTSMEQAGRMQDNYFLYYEEMDWCEKMRRAGYTIWVDTTALIYHKESVSVGSKSALKEYFMNRNRILFIRRNCGYFTRSIFWTYFIFVVTPRNIISYLKNGQTQFIQVLFRAIIWNITNSTNSTVTGFKFKSTNNE
jgi:GT2 family glycosyltransferase